MSDQKNKFDHAFSEICSNPSLLALSEKSQFLPKKFSAHSLQETLSFFTMSYVRFLIVGFTKCNTIAVTIIPQIAVIAA
ncbi:MAG: hypothetical protein LBV52_05820, partial [Spirochaetaceae bacterium]|nr:hypothetical protein [Spirochaetaceae bacterium]